MAPPPFDPVVFVRCTAPESTCELPKGFFFGGAGVCNAATGLCECPAGFTGVDDVAVYNDCHIHVAFRLACHLITLVLTAAAAVISVAALAKLAVMWGVVFWASDAPAANTRVPGSYYNEFDSLDKNKGGETPTANDSKARISVSHVPPGASPKALFQAVVSPARQSNSESARSSLGTHKSVRSVGFGDGLDPYSPTSRNLVRSVSAPMQQMQTVELNDQEPKSSDGEGKVVGRGSTVEGSQPKVKRKKSRAPRLSMKPMQQPKTNVRSASLVHDMSVARRRRNTCILMSGFALHSVFAVALIGCFMSYITLAQRNEGLLSAMGISLASFQTSIWVLAYSWCGSLHSMKGYARMFPHFASHPLVRFPWMASAITIFSWIASLVICFTFFLGLPLSADQTELQTSILPVGLTLLAAVIFVLTLFQSSVFWLLLKMFATNMQETNQQRSKATNSNMPSEQGPGTLKRQLAFIKARKTVRLVLISGLFTGPFVVTILLIGAWTKEGRRHMYFFFSALYSLMALMILSSTYVVVYRISSGENQVGGQLGPMTTNRTTRHQSQGGGSFSLMASSPKQAKGGLLNAVSHRNQDPVAHVTIYDRHNSKQSKESTDLNIS